MRMDPCYQKLLYPNPVLNKGRSVISRLRRKGFQIAFFSHAEAILRTDFPEVLTEVATVLRKLSISVEDLVRGGGGESKMTQSLRRSFRELGWGKHKFEIKKLIDGKERESISHQVDHVRKLPGGQIALEIEWNNKDPFFDRDLENFKRLHGEGAISVGIILTRGQSLQERIKSYILAFATKKNVSSYKDLEPYGVDPTRRQQRIVNQRIQSGATFQAAWADAFCADKYGQATTHWRKLEDRISRGVGNPCPLLLIGIRESVVV